MTAELDDAEAIARRLWDLDAWSARAERLRDALSELVDSFGGDGGGYVGGDDDRTLAPGFVLSAAVLRHFEADPLLPAALLASSWPGDDLRREYEAYDKAFRRAWRERTSVWV